MPTPRPEHEEHTWETEGGPGGIINTPREFWPEGWEFVEGESSPKVEDA
jgi:hypothetical protein